MVDVAVVVGRARAAARGRLNRERSVIRAVAETTGAAGAAWLIARQLLPEPRPVFAPLTAIISLGISRGTRGARALQVSFGVAVGLGAADVIVRLLGVGTWQLMLVTALALFASVLISGSDTLSIQAGVSGALVVAVGSVSAEVPFRFLEALVGAAVALLISQILSPFDARGGAVGALSRVLEEIAAALQTAAEGLDGDRDDWAQQAQRQLRGARMRLIHAEDLVATGRRAADFSRRRGGRGAFDRARHATDHLDLALADARSLMVAIERVAQAEREPEQMRRGLRAAAALARCAAEDPAGSDRSVIAQAREITERMTDDAVTAQGFASREASDLLVRLVRTLREVITEDRPPVPRRRLFRARMRDG